MCERIQTPTGVAIVCGGHPRRRCRCGRAAQLLCDWKVQGERSGTCDAPVCSACVTSPAPGKDLCRAHGEAYRTWLAERAAATPDQILLEPKVLA